MADGLARLYDHFVPGYREGFARGAAPLLDPALLREVNVEYATDPDGVLARARRAVDATLTPDTLRQLIDHLGWVFDHPDEAIADAVARGPALPADFTFPGIEPGPTYQPDPGNKRFSDRDWTGFGLNCGSALLKRSFVGMAPFRWHGDYASAFCYDLPRNANLAMFADFGTGLAHSWYIAKFIAAARPDAAIHLGDVYYSGRLAEASAFYDAPLSPLVVAHELWSIPGNHDYYAGGEPFFRGLDARRDGLRHRQEGSYFCLDSPAFRVIAIDGEYHSGTRYDQEEELQRWLAERVAEARSAAKTVILLSSDEPYTYDAEREEPLLHDVTDSLAPDAIDLWLWGNTHYCAFFKPSDRLRAKFHGTCIGHGGYQYARLRSTPSASDVASYLWAETEPRFPAWTGVGQELGNNGHRTVTLTYRDWTNAPRATITLSPSNGHLAVSSFTAHPRSLCR
jgi:predicted phosphodiesterase